MAIERVANPIQVKFTLVGGAEVTVKDLTEANVETNPEFVAANMGTAQVDSHYQGKRTGAFNFSTTKLTNVVALVEGAKVTGVELIAGAAVDSAGTAVGANIKRTMSKGMIEKVTDPTLSNASRAPAAVQVTIRLSRHEGDTEDPTISPWTEVTA